MVAAVLFIALVVTLVLNMPVGIAIGVSSLCAILADGRISSLYIVQQLVTSADSFPLMAIPLFILAGELMGAGGVSKRLLNVCNVFLGRFTGGLATVTVVLCMFFAAVSGSGPATVAAIGSMVIPTMLDKGYSKSFTLALIAAAGSIGVIIPPSIPMVIYGVSTSTSISSLFMAGFLPGILIGFSLIVVSYLYCKKQGWKVYFDAMDIALDAAVIIANRYADMAEEKAKGLEAKDKERFKLMAATLRKVPENGAENLYEAIQLFIIMWQVMCLEQTPNPYAFSVGNADRIFEPYRSKEDTGRDMTAALLKHLLVFYNVADRSWAISQNLIIGGKSNTGEDMTNPTSYALLDAYYDMNLPQPILSVKLHKNTPDKLYESLGRFLFTPGCLTPSFFNDDSVFEFLKEKNHVEPQDLEDYSVAGCQEPLIMGKDNGNTTNSWLNMAKVLELCINDGKSEISGKKFGKSYEENGCKNALELLQNIRPIFYENLEEYVDQMVECANAASEAISILQVPFLSTLMDGIKTGVDTRDTKTQGTKYNGSGCLIHGLSVVADSFAAIDTLLAERPEDAERMVEALRDNFEHDPEMRQYLMKAKKYGNNIASVDKDAAEIAGKVSDMVCSKKNYLGNAFRADWASPSTHLLYGYWVGATPDGRLAREELGYGIDPLYGEAHQGLGFRIMSNMKLPFDKMNGGCASHLGINPNYFKSETMEGKGMEFKDKIMAPLFFNPKKTDGISPFYLYVNVTTPEMLRKVLANPKKYAPSGVYIMRIHGTFVNFLDLSPDI